MIVLNFSHPLKTKHLAEIEKLSGSPINRIENLSKMLDASQPFSDQVRIQIDSLNYSNIEWTQEKIIVNLPNYGPIAGILLAELHGRMGFFPSILRFRYPDKDHANYEIVEIINLQNVRDIARVSR